MEPSFRFGLKEQDGLRILSEDSERVFYRTWRAGASGNHSSALLMLPAAEHPSPSTLERLVHEYRLKEAWAQLSAMARQTKKAMACLLIVPVFLAMTASVICADTLVLAAADTWPTAYLVHGRPTGMLVELVTEAYRRAGHPVEVKLMPWARCLKDAETGEVDGDFSSFKLPERERFLAFPKEALTI